MPSKRKRRRHGSFRKTIRSTIAIGAPPGTIAPAEGAVASVIDVMAYGPSSLREEAAVSLDAIDSLRAGAHVTWMNVTGVGTAAVLKDLASRFDLHLLALEDVVNVHQRPKVEGYGDTAFVVLNLPSLDPGTGRLDLEQLSFFVGRRFVLTVQERRGDCFDPVRSRLRAARGRIRSEGADFLAYALIDAVVDSFFPTFWRDCCRRFRAVGQSPSASAFGLEKTDMDKKLKKDVSLPVLVDQEVKRWLAEQGAFETRQKEQPVPRPVITISLALGAGAEEIAAGLSNLTGFTVMDEALLDAIARDLGVQKKLLEPLDEDVRNDLERWLQGVIDGRLVLKSDYMRSLTRVVGSVAKYGRSILVGRGAGYILGPNRAFHVRVVAPRKVRAKSIAERRDIPPKEAEKLVAESDERLVGFIAKSFDRDINDPLLYDLVINTTSYSMADAVELILLAYGKKERRLTKADR